METPVLGVILDSSVAIEAERDKLDVAGFLKRIAGIVGERQAALSWSPIRLISRAGL
jgi:hypothetical protein